MPNSRVNYVVFQWIIFAQIISNLSCKNNVCENKHIFQSVFQTTGHYTFILLSYMYLIWGICMLLAFFRHRFYENDKFVFVSNLPLHHEDVCWCWDIASSLGCFTRGKKASCSRQTRDWMSLGVGLGAVQKTHFVAAWNRIALTPPSITQRSINPETKPLRLYYLLRFRRSRDRLVMCKEMSPVLLGLGFKSLLYVVW